MLVRDVGSLRAGGSGLLLFAIGFAIWLMPLFGGRTGLQHADDLFNQLAKQSTYFQPEAGNRAAVWHGVPVDLGVGVKSPAEAQAVVRLVAAAGGSARALDDGRVRVEGDLGQLGQAAVDDADLLFHGREADLEARYSLDARQVVHNWWTIFDGLAKRYVQLNRSDEADFAKYVATRVLEPAFNFAGIQPKRVSELFGAASLLLGFYLVFTIWYGFSILAIFEGLGIRATASAAQKKEA
jgi:hypothetical protein